MTRTPVTSSTAASGISCRGDVEVRAGARLAGDVKATGRLHVGSDARIDGAAHADGGVAWHASARAARLTTDGPFRIGEHVVAGSLEARRGVAPADEGAERP